MADRNGVQTLKAWDARLQAGKRPTAESVYDRTLVDDLDLAIGPPVNNDQVFIGPFPKGAEIDWDNLEIIGYGDTSPATFAADLVEFVDFKRENVLLTLTGNASAVDGESATRGKSMEAQGRPGPVSGAGWIRFTLSANPAAGTGTKPTHAELDHIYFRVPWTGR